MSCWLYQTTKNQFTGNVNSKLKKFAINDKIVCAQIKKNTAIIFDISRIKTIKKLSTGYKFTLETLSSAQNFNLKLNGSLHTLLYNFIKNEEKKNQKNLSILKLPNDNIIKSLIKSSKTVNKKRKEARLAKIYEEKYYIVPIMLDLCDTFLDIDDNQDIETIFHHLDRCTLCEIIDNGPHRVNISVIKNNKLIIVEDENESRFTDLTEKYYSMEKYEDKRLKKDRTNFVLYYVNDETSIYYNSAFISCYVILDN